MKFQFYSKYFICIFFAVGIWNVTSQNKSHLSINKEGIRVYVTKLDTTVFKEYKAVMTVKAPIDSVSKVILDVDKVKTWNFKTQNSQLLKKISDSSWVFYMAHHWGWPIQDRDHVSKATLIKKRDEQIITLVPYNNYLKERKDYIRLKNFKGYWHLKKIDDNQTLVVQQIYGNPEGDIPPFMVNLIVSKGPFDTFKALRNRLENLNKK